MSKARKVVNLESFIFDKESGKIIQQEIRKLPVAVVASLSVTT
jgi:hypothetical protein